MIRVLTYTVLCIVLIEWVTLLEKKGKTKCFKITVGVYFFAVFYFTILSRFTIQPIDLTKKAIFFLTEKISGPAADFSAVEDSINKSYIVVRDEGSRWYTLPTIILNILLYVPYGMMTKVLFVKKTRWQLLLIAMMLSLSTEVIQFVFHLGVFDVVDIIMNTLGAAIGLFILSPLMGQKG